MAFPSDKDATGPTPHSPFAGIGQRIEEFVGGCLLGNVRQGERKINDFFSRLRSDCAAGVSKVWLCGAVLRADQGLSAAAAAAAPARLEGIA